MNFSKKSNKRLEWFNKISSGDLSRVSPRFLKRIFLVGGAIIMLAAFFIWFEVYFPFNPGSREVVKFRIESGWSDEQISRSLKSLGIIRSAYFFNLYAFLSLKHASLQAGEYSISPKMSIYDIVSMMASGNVIKDQIVIPEGWDISDIGTYLESRGLCSKDDFISLANKDYSGDFNFLKDKPRGLSLEGYLFPDTYQISKGETCEGVIVSMLSNFDKKLTMQLRNEITKQNKSIFNIITMASLIEKEVRSLEDKKIVSGILWKRIAAGMPLQLDSTIVYITGRTSISNKDKQIDSPYNTYKYYALPKGPISNPGIDSINSAIYPTQTKYWYYLTDGVTIFSETFDQHNRAKNAMQSHL